MRIFRTKKDSVAQSIKTGKGGGKLASQPKPASGGELRQEVMGFLFLGLALVLFLSLVTYSSADPVLAEEGGRAENWIGRLGAILANTSLQGFGYSAYLVVLALGALGVFLGLRRSVAIKIKGAGGFILIAFFCSVLFDLALPEKGLHHAPGGLVGGLIVKICTPYLGVVGLTISSVLGLILAMVLATNLPPLRTGAALFRAAAKLSILTLNRVWGGAGFVFGKTEGGAAFLSLLYRRWRKARIVKAVERAAERELKNQNEASPYISEATETLNEEEAEGTPRPRVLDRGEKDVTIEVRRSVAESLGGKADESEAEAEPLGRDGNEAGKDGDPEIIDSRPRRKTDAELGEEALELDELPLKEYELPKLSLLDQIVDEVSEFDKEQLYANARMLEQTLLDYKIEGKVTEIHPGPVITMYEFAPARGTKISRIANLEDDLAMALAALKVRIVAPIPGKSVVGIEVPSANREMVFFKEIVGQKEFSRSKSKLTMALGKDIFGYPVYVDLQKMPHLLIAGATGAGKSVGVNAMILSVLYRCTPEEVKFILIDPKRLEFNFYEGIPHLLLPVVIDPKQAALALGWVVHEMEKRYKLLSDWGVKNIDSYNKLVSRLDEARERRGGDIDRLVEEFSASEGGDVRALANKLKTSSMPKRMPFIVVVIDELADLMMVSGKEVELSIARLAQLARASGIHLIVATQRPSTDVLTGLIKNNFPARISFKVSQKVDSRTILDRNGAEALLGRGDMLYLTGGGGLRRVHGAYISEEETARIVHFIKQQRKATYQTDILDRIKERAEEKKAEDEEYDSEYDHAVAIVCNTGRASISMIQRKLRVGYNRAARMVEKMEEEGVVGPPDGVKGRQVYGKPIKDD